MSDEMTPAEYAQYLRDHATLQAAHKANPEVVRQALKDVVDFPPKSGDLKN